MSKQQIAKLEAGKYLSFATLKRSGDYVATPVWFAPLNGHYYLFSAEDAGKVKRLRNFSEARVAPCTVSGKLKGEFMDTQAELLDSPEDIATALEALHKKYGLSMKVTDFFSGLTGKKDKRAYIRVHIPQ
ncbi:PPOX class F420-dependent oxidoreductase [Halioglobus maricola]|uniref:PPOX class F420-dependent oxidoreductase n=1 Tax=Halioglobus maricola TaxID=2601894 RepID=A0A5P9NG95_9GAMM|nr:PPOX class F420-dependent oxidoreductase [Halioglobus maricola]QFU74559.1 PPOX class F420-dependent oxidoreductase [Halioglobus maricola]